MTSLRIAELLYLLMCNPENGEVSTTDYPKIKNLCQAALGLELERFGRVSFQDGYVLQGPQRPEKLQRLELLLESLKRPESQTYRWFLLRLDPPQALISQWLCQCLVDQGLMHSQSTTRLLFFSQTTYPLTSKGQDCRKQWRTRLQMCWQSLVQNQKPIESHPAPLLAAAWLVDLFGAAGLAGLSAERLPLSATQQLLETGILSSEFVRAATAHAHNVSDLGSLVNFASDICALIETDYRYNTGSIWDW